MDTASPSALFLCGKSSAEIEFAKSLKSNDALDLPNGGKISTHLQSEINSSRFGEDAFNVDLFFSSLSTKRFGRFLIWSPLLSSTHDIVSHNFCELPVGAVCVADTQSKGRGRSKNAWESPRGCLMLSFTLQMDDGKIVPLVQYVVCLAVTEAIKDVCDRNGFPCIDVRIKWPNDLYLNGLKVGGILCTSTYKSKKFNVSSGLGLNVGNEKPTTCLNTVLKELSASSNEFRREDIMAAFFNKFEMLYDIFISQGFQTLEELYYRTWLHSCSGVFKCTKWRNLQESGFHGLPYPEKKISIFAPVSLNVQNGETFKKVVFMDCHIQRRKFPSVSLAELGQRVIVQEKNEDRVVENLVTIQGLTSSGYLLAIGDDKQMCELHPNGNSFDFFNGLLRRKLE
ncbi:hypothetical protein V6N13_012158 [Hibiscus sabdariffa]